jgi:hypothetical protein
MNAYERLMAEAIPTGTFGYARPARRQHAEPAPRWTPEEQAAHWAELEAALNETETGGPRPRLRVIDGTSTSTTTHREDAA